MFIAAGAVTKCCPIVSGAASSPPRSRVRVCCSRRNGAIDAAVSAATALLRFFQPGDSRAVGDRVAEDDSSSFQIDEIVDHLKSDYDRSYFLTGDFTLDIYEENCYFADPTIQFRGRDLYKRNLMLLVPFYENPSLVLLKLDPEVIDYSSNQLPRSVNNDRRAIRTSWKLRTYLKLPWKPLITLDGSTRYELDSSCKVISHVESWSVSPLQALSQLFKGGL